MKIVDKQLKKEKNKKTITPYYITHRALQFGLNTPLDNHHISHVNA